MAIQNRRGVYTDFDPTRMLAGEFAIVQDGDPNSSTGRSLYICIEPGVVKRIADYDDLGDLVADVAEEYIDDFDEAVDALTTLIPATEQAKNDANAAAAAASAVVLDGNAGLGHAYASCDTQAGTSSKTVTIAGFNYEKGGILSIKFVYGATDFNSININSTGAKDVYYHGISGVPSSIIGKGDIATFIYDGTRFHLITVDSVPLWINIGTISSLPVTKNINRINSSMICAKAVLGTPSAQTGDWTVTTSNGSLTISGSISGSTTVELLLIQGYSFSVG